jgi:hypothetical protein
MVSSIYGGLYHVMEISNPFSKCGDLSKLHTEIQYHQYTNDVLLHQGKECTHQFRGVHVIIMYHRTE